MGAGSPVVNYAEDQSLTTLFGDRTGALWVLMG